MAQKADEPKYALVNMLFDCCLKKKFPHVEHNIGKPLTAFDPDSGRNFAYDKGKQEWIDTKTGRPICPGSKGEPPQYALVNILFDCCLKKKFPQVEHNIGKPLTAFDPDSGRNFAYDKEKQAWIDVKTLECICPKCPPSRTAQQPTPTPGQNTGETIKKVLESVNIGIGIGGGHTFRHDEHHHGEDRTRTADKVHTDSKTHTIGKTPSNTHKTVTSACKCHPCTCSPCTCH